MRFVETAVIRPNRCAVIPFIASNDDEGFIDTGSEMDGFEQHVYVSVKAVKEMARMIGWVGPGDYNRIVSEANKLARTIEDLTVERDELQKRFDAIDVLASADFRARNKAGRPRKETANAG